MNKKQEGQIEQAIRSLKKVAPPLGDNPDVLEARQTLIELLQPPRHRVTMMCTACAAPRHFHSEGPSNEFMVCNGCGARYQTGKSYL